MIRTSAIILLLIFLLPLPHGFSELQNEIVTQDVTGTIGYRDDVYFTVVIKTDFGQEGHAEMGFARTDDLQLPSMVSWDEITEGLAVRVTYEEVLSPHMARTGGLETSSPAVLERRAIKLVIGQKLKRKVLAS